MQILGIDVGGTGIKGAPVDIDTGELLAERQRIPTPDPAKPKAVGKVVAEIAQHFAWNNPIGIGFPAVIRGGVAFTAANIHPKWIETNADALFAELTRCPVKVINDADAAGLAEVTFGAGRGYKGTILMVTIGTGLGTALFVDGKLYPNTELGHIELDGGDAEWMASDAARQRENLSWKKWAKRFDRYLGALERLLWPDLIILGGGVSKESENFLPLLTVKSKIVTATLLNQAGIVGAALSAQHLVK